MRFYDIKIGGQIPIQYTTWVNGKTDPGALRVEFDLSVQDFATPFQNPKVRIWGVGIKQISNATQLNLAPIQVYGGMKPGLPIATAEAQDNQAGLLVSGQIFNPYGNWINEMQTLELPIIVATAAGIDMTQVDKLNLVLTWLKGQPIGPAIQACLQTAFPGVKVTLNITSNVVYSQDYSSHFSSIGELASAVKSISQQIVNGPAGGTYPGISIVPTAGAFTVFDASTQAAPKAINFIDLIGQPTWIKYPNIQFTTVMRADLSVGDRVSLPPSQYTTQSSDSFSSGRATTAQTGIFQIVLVHHVGDSRQPGAASWVSVFEAIPSA